MTHDIRAAIGCSWGDDLVDDPDPYANGAAPIYEGEFFTEPHTFIGFRVVWRGSWVRRSLSARRLPSG